MKPLSLNMDRYHKVSDDGKTSTLRQHDTGHTITIAHSALPREQRNYLKALPLYSEDQGDPEQAQAPQAMYKGGRTINPSYDDAVELRGDKEQFGSNDPDDNVESNPDYKKQVAQALQGKYQTSNKARASKEKDQLIGGLKKRAHYDDGTPEKPVSQSDAAEPAPSPSDGGSEPNPQASTPININIGAGPQPAPVAQAPTPPIPPAQQQQQVAPTDATPEPSLTLTSAQKQLDQLQGNVPQANDVQPPGGASSVQNIKPDTEAPTYLGGLGQEIKGGLQQAQALGTLGAQQAMAQDQAAADRGVLAQHFQDSMDKLNKERLANAQDVRNGFVDPSKYWDNHSKMRTGLGLILAGFNPTRSPNAALEFLQNNIQRDTQAQLANLGAKQDLLSHTVQQFGNVRAGVEFANVLKTDQVANKLAAAASRSQNAQQAGLFNMWAGQLKQSAAQRMIPLAAMQGAMGAMRGGTDPSEILPQLRVAAPEMAKTVEEHLFPRGTAGGGGTTDRPVTPEAINQVAAQSNILLKTQRLQNWIDANTVGGVISPAHRGEGEALAAELAQFYRQGTGASTSEAEQKTIQNFINPKPTGFLSAYMEDPKLHALTGSMQDSINNLKKHFGFHPFNEQNAPAQPPQQAAPPEATPSGLTQVQGKNYKSVYSPKLGRNVLVPA
jgi:hypothetical protein